MFCLFVICFFYGVILLFHFRLKTPYWSSFAVVSYVVFNLGCCVFTQYNLLVGYPGWILIQHRTQVRDYSLTGLTWNINLIIGISHLSISGIVVHGRCYIFHCFYFSVFAWLFVGWFLFFAFVFMSVDSSLSNQEPILTFLLSFW